MLACRSRMTHLHDAVLPSTLRNATQLLERPLVGGAIIHLECWLRPVPSKLSSAAKVLRKLAPIRVELGVCARVVVVVDRACLMC